MADDKRRIRTGPRPGLEGPIRGNRLGKGRPWGIPRVTLHLTYRDALQRACSPQDVLEITKRAVADAKKGDAHARLFIAMIMGLDSLRITVDPAAHPAPNPPVYHLDALDDDELAVLGRLSAKMLEGPGE